MILLTGATGHIGSTLVRLLAAGKTPVRALTRNPGGAAPMPGVEWVRGDLADAKSLPKLFEGADTLFLLTSNGQDMATLQRNAVTAAKSAGVSRIVKQSALGASDHSKSPIGRAHHEVEKAIEGSGMAWTFLRPHVFMQNLLGLAPSIARDGVLRSASGEGKIPFIDARDIAEVAAVALTTRGHDGKKYVLTGPKALSYRDVATAVQAATGKPVKYIAETEAQARARMAREGAPAWEIESTLALAGYQRAGGPTEAVSPVVQQVLGRPPRSVEAFVAENSRAFGGK
jgi:uncharacterized protein YbjT (DUF2867 family)